jgi:inhibitor of KinA sporulation pathway (predicted exonuclease)
MPIRRDKLVVVDLELTCWEGNPPAGQQNEIIEIGICLLDLKTLDVAEGRSILVRPERSRVSFYCTELTTLTQERLDHEGLRFHEAVEIVKALYGSKDRAWTSWGNYDRKMFQQQCRERGVPYPFSQHHLNASRLFGEQEARTRKGIGMARALDMTGIRLDGTHHRGEDDAWNVAGMIAYLVRKYGKEILQPLWRE